MYRDSSDKELTDYPRPSVAVDTAVLTARAGTPLQVLLHRRAGEHHGGEWALPGTFVHDRERLAEAVHRSLRDKAGLEVSVEPEQLHVFDDPDRDERGWVMSVAHVAVVPWDDVEAALAARRDGLVLAPVDEVTGLPFDHDEIARRAADWVRHEYALRPDPRRLLGPRFTLRQLYDLHLAVAPRPGPGQRPPSEDTFRRYMVDKARLVEPTGETTRGEGGTGKPAAWYRRVDGDRDLTALMGVRPLRPDRASGHRGT